MTDIGIWMRPDVLARKKAGRRGSWYFRDDYMFESLGTGVKIGDHLWICVGERWAGYFTIAGVRRADFGVEWDSASWVSFNLPTDAKALQELRHGFTSRVPPLSEAPCIKCGGPVETSLVLSPFFSDTTAHGDRYCWLCGKAEVDCRCESVDRDMSS